MPSSSSPSNLVLLAWWDVMQAQGVSAHTAVQLQHFCSLSSGPFRQKHPSSPVSSCPSSQGEAVQNAKDKAPVSTHIQLCKLTCVHSWQPMHEEKQCLPYSMGCYLFSNPVDSREESRSFSSMPRQAYEVLYQWTATGWLHTSRLYSSWWWKPSFGKGVQLSSDLFVAMTGHACRKKIDILPHTPKYDLTLNCWKNIKKKKSFLPF